MSTKNIVKKNISTKQTQEVKEVKIQKEVKSKKDKNVEIDGSYQKLLQNFWNKYSTQTHPRIKIIDWFIIFLISIMSIQFFYRLVVGDDFPKNAFLTGMFCPLGVIVLLLQLRKSQKKNLRKLGQFFIACLVLFVVSINFVG